MLAQARTTVVAPKAYWAITMKSVFFVNQVVLTDQVRISAPVYVNKNGSQRVSFSKTFDTGAMLFIESDGVTIENFEITNQTALSNTNGPFPALVTTTKQTTLKNCVLSGNTLGSLTHTNQVFSRLILVESPTGNLLIDNCDIRENESGNTTNNELISVDNEARLEIHNTVITQNNLSQGELISSRNRSRLIVNNATISNNVATRGNILILNSLASRISNSKIFSNFAGAIQPGTIRVNGTENNAALDIVDSDIYANNGHGIFITNADVNLRRTTISGQLNERIGIAFGATEGKESNIKIFDSTINENSGPGILGGVFEEPNSKASLIVTNSTISGNLKNGVTVFTSGAQRTIDVSIVNTTIANNQGLSFGTAGSGVDITLQTGNVNFVNNIVTGNASGAQIRLAGLTVTNDFNVIGDSRDTIENQVSPGFIPGINSVIASSNGNAPSATNRIIRPLNNNGGQTNTHALPANSPAINTGAQFFCQLFTEGLDQIGNPRNDGQCDIGAMEFFEDDETCYVVKTKQAKVVTFCL